MLEDEIEITILQEENQQLRNRIKQLEEWYVESKAKELEELLDKRLEEEYQKQLKACDNTTIHNINVVTNKLEDKPLTYEQWLETEEGDNLANAYAEAMNIDVSEELI